MHPINQLFQSCFYFVLVPASITSPSSSVLAVRRMNEGEPIPLVCVATGHPSPRVTWTKDGKTVGVNGDATIVKSTRGDAGDYTCTATNGVGESKTVTVTVEITCKLLPSTCLHSYSVYNCFLFPVG